MKLVFNFTLVLSLLLFNLVVAEKINTNNTIVMEDNKESKCIELNTRTSNGRSYYSFIIPAKYSCEEIGFTVNLCDPIIPEIVEIVNVPKIATNGDFEVTLIGEEDIMTKTLKQKLLETVKGPSQYFIVPDETKYLTYHLKLKINSGSDICDNSEKFDKMIVQVYGVEKVTEMDDDDISEELEQLCYNNFMVVPFNIVLQDDDMKKNLMEDLNLLEKEDNIIVTKLLSASYISDKGDPDKDLCRGFLYLKSMNTCNKIRLEEVKGSKPLSQNISSILSIGDKAPKFIKDCIREFTIKPEEKVNYENAKTVEETDWFVKMEL